MKRTKLLNRSVAFLLTLIMVIGLCPQYVHAEDVPADPHTHSYNAGICSCGNVCPHTEYTDGKCTVCGMDEPHTHFYANGICSCGDVCPHTEYADGKCTVCGMDEPHTHFYTDGICSCGDVCPHTEYTDGKCTVCGMEETASVPDPVYGTTTFVYAGSNENITGSNLVFYFTWGVSTNNSYPADCGITVSASGNRAVLTVDKNTLTDSTVWLNAWDNVAWTAWNGISTTFSGETYYLTDDGVSTTPPADPDPEPHTHTYVEGVCECGEICPHTAYVDGKCTVCGMDEPHTHTYVEGVCSCGDVCPHTEYADGKCTVCGMEKTATEPDIGTTTFVYAGTNEVITADNLVAYITWGTETYNDNAENCGFTVGRSGKNLTLRVDKNILTDAVWMKIWDNVEWTTWDSINPSFTGETYYLTDDGVSTTPPADPDPEPHTHTYVEGVCECGEICPHAAYVDGKCTVCGMDEPHTHTYVEGVCECGEVCPHAEYVDGKCTVCGMAKPDPEPMIPEDKLGQATFIYEGTNANVTASNLVAYITWGTATYNANAEDCGFRVIRSGNTVILQVDKTTLTDTTVWLKIWEDQEWTTWDSIGCTFRGEIYHLRDGGVYTVDSGGTEDPKPEEPAYQFTVHCYGEGYQMGAWMALVENGTEVAWTPSTPAKTAVFGNPEDGWTSATITWDLTDTYNRFGCTIGIDDPWASSKYNYDFTEPSGEIWIIPGDPRVYPSKKAALEGMQTEYEPTYSFTIHCKGQGYQIGAWLELVTNGTVTAWTPAEDGITAFLENPEDGWTSATISWDNTETYNRLGFILGTSDPWKGTRYTYEFDASTGEDVWIVPGYGGAYATKEAAEANAWSYYYQFKIHCYGEGYQVGAWMAKVVDGEETQWTPAASSVIRPFRDLQDGWSTATVSWRSKTRYNRLGFQIGVDSPWEATQYSFDFTERIGEIWILPDDPTVYLSEEAALDALNNPASAKYSFHVHCYGEHYQVGAWMALVRNHEEVAWSADSAAFTGAFTPEADGWSDIWVKWNLPDTYNRLGFTIGVEDPWASASYCLDFKECPAEIWIVPGDMNIYLSKEEAEEAMAPGVEMTIPPETEPSETEPAEVPAQKEEKSGSVVIGLVIGFAAAGGFIWWLILFLRKRKMM